MISQVRGAPSEYPANYVFADSLNVADAGAPAMWSRAGIGGDGRLRSGDGTVGSPSNEYQGGSCGVSAILASQGFNTDPDIDWTFTTQSTCGEARSFAFRLAGLDAPPTMLGPHSIVDSLNVIAVGQSSRRMVRFGVQLTNCAGIRFGNAYPPANDARVTRLPDVISATGVASRSWMIESQGSHRGACVVSTKKGFVTNGVSYYLPFALTVTEVR
ncbi:MAG: hypothetical protein ABIS03_06795 [Gemmatimonadaceae bacterium]